MIPLIHWTQFSVGPLTIQVWGLFVALGMIAGLLVALRVARHRGLHQQRMIDLAFWVIVVALIGGRFIYVLSEWEYYGAHLFQSLALWDGGMSISGGYIGAFIAGVLYLRHHNLPILTYAEACIIGLPLGLGIGRLGCFFIFDHPGTVTSFFLGQQYLDGLVRHNHGLYLSIDGFLLALLFFFLWKRNPKRPEGFFTVFFLFWHGVVRFCLDFFRASDLTISDPRYLGLTVAQYVSLAMIAGGAILWYILFYAKSNTKKAS